MHITHHTTIHTPIHCTTTPVHDLTSAMLANPCCALQTAAFATMSECCLNAGNRDVEFVVPAIISCIARPDEVQECIHKLSATTFVQAVETPVLSILVPLLIRGLRERVTAIKRKSSVILDNMAKVRTAECFGGWDLGRATSDSNMCKNVHSSM